MKTKHASGTVRAYLNVRLLQKGIVKVKLKKEKKSDQLGFTVLYKAI